MTQLISSEIEFKNILQDSNSNLKLLVIDFFTTWCDLCSRFSPEFDQITKEFSSGVNFIKIDCSKSPDLVMKFKIKSLPTVKGYFNTEELFSLSGSNVSKLSNEIKGNCILPVLNSLFIKTDSSIPIHNLLKVIDNIINTPSNEQYRTLKLADVEMHKDLFVYDGIKDCLLKLGFQETDDRLFIDEPISFDLFKQYQKQLLMLLSMRKVKIEEVKPVEFITNHMDDFHTDESISTNSSTKYKPKRSVIKKMKIENFTFDDEIIKTPKKQLSNELRRNIINGLENNLYTRKEASEIFNIPYGTIACIYRKFCRSEETDKKVRTIFKPKKLEGEHIAIISEWLADDCTLTLTSIANRICEDFNISICSSTISKYIDDFHFTINQLQLIPSNNINDTNDDLKVNTNEEKKTYGKWLRQAIAGERNIIFIYESNYRISMRKFQRKTVNDDKAMVKNKTRKIITAMTSKSLFYYKALGESGNTISFIDILQEIITKINEKHMKNVSIVLDNTQVNNLVIDIENLLSKNGFELVFLPSKCNNLNPVQLLFSRWQTIIRSENPKTEEQLMKLVDEFPTIEANNSQYHDYFKDCYKNSIDI